MFIECQSTEIFKVYVFCVKSLDFALYGGENIFVHYKIFEHIASEIMLIIKVLAFDYVFYAGPCRRNV